MAEYNRPSSVVEFEKNMKQKKPSMTDNQAYYESSRCLFCFDAPCIQACPAGIDIPLFIRQINAGQPEMAAKTIFEANWMGYACGKICPTGVLCEGGCVYNETDVKPLEIGRLQAFATGEVIKSGKKLFDLAPSNGKKVAVIGGGPAGIAGACELRLLGYDVDIYEAKDKPTGLTVFGIASYKITNEEVLAEEGYLRAQFGYNMKLNSPITSKEQITELENNYDAILMGVGIGATATLGIPGEDKAGVIGAVEIIEDIRMKKNGIVMPENVVVLGGGNTAMDAASQSARLGADNVSLIYRRGKESMGAYSFEYDLAVAAGVDGVFNVSPIEIIGNGKATGVKCVRTESVGGKLQNVEGSEFVIPADLVIKATGQAKQGALHSLIDGLDLDWGKVKVNELHQTTNPMYFAAGDAVNGGAEVVNAAAEAKVAAHGIHKFIQG